jgi:hypothetical protein
MPEVLE